MVSPVVMYGCESWTIKKAEWRRIDAFELGCWWRLLRVPWTARRSYQWILKKSVLNIHWKDWSWSWNSKTLANWWKNWLICKDPEAGKDWRQEGKGTTEAWEWWMSLPTLWTWIWVSSGSWWWTEKPGMLQSMGSERVWHNWATKLNWTTPKAIPGWLSGQKKCTYNAGDVDLIPGLGRSPGEGRGNPPQYSCLENPMDRGAWWITVLGVAKSQTQLKQQSTNACTLTSWEWILLSWVREGKWRSPAEGNGIPL